MEKLLFNLLIFFVFYGSVSAEMKDSVRSKSSQALEVTGYCTSSLGGTSFDISSVSFTGTTLNNTTSGTTATSDGSYYTAFSKSGSTTATLYQGRTYTLSVISSNTDIISVWIDYNQNGSFESTEWTQVATSSSAGSPSSISITIPVSATLGETAMRIRTRNAGNSNAASDACSSFGSGCTQDYTITIISPTPAVPVANFTSTSTITTPGGLIQFSDFSTGVPTSWKWTFPGGTPATSTSQNPTVNYNINGTYAVTLVASNSLGRDSITKVNYVTVTGAINIPVSGSSSVTTCNAIIYDNGGTSTYSNSSDGTLIVYPATPGSAVKIDFNSFNTESYDRLYIYNGTSSSATLIATYYGTTLPASVTATNPDGALTLRFVSDSYGSLSGFVAQASCADLILQNVSSVSWSNSIDNNANTYAQSKIMSYSIKNSALTSATVYAKIYGKLSSTSSYTLLTTTSNVAISASSTFAQTYQVTGLNTQGIYDFKIELYNQSNSFLNTCNSTVNSVLGGQYFESVASDALPDYCTSGLGGSYFDISGVSITNTTLSNTASRSGAVTSDGSYYTLFPATGSTTCTLTAGSLYTLNVSTSGSDNLSAWIDFNQDKALQANEWIQVSPTGTAVANASVNFIVPNTAVTGQTRLRIRSNYYYNTNGSSNACTQFYSGCTEDYNISIAAPVLAKPVANFIASQTSVSIGSTVQFYDITTGAPASWKWTFTGGTPTSSTLQNPSVVYNTAGTYAVKLVVANSLGTDSITKTTFITVVNTVNVPVSGATSVTACGVTVYDNGGTGSYSNSTSGTLTIYPSTTGNAVKLQFSEFNTESSCDILYVYNGTSTSAALLGSYSGSSIPADITATNLSGALTLRFTTDGSVTSTGFVAQATCIPLLSQYVSSASWTSVVDNNYNGFAQSKTLNYTVKNDAASATTVYAKIYARQSAALTDSLLTTTAPFVIAASSSTSLQTYVVSGLNIQDSYNLKIEIYSSSNVLLSTYDGTSNALLSSQKFESAALDGATTYCTGNLSGGSFDITAVSISNTTLNNSSTRTAIRTTDGSYYTELSASGNNTATLTTGRTYTINVTAKNTDIISVWIDYNQDKIFQTNEWTQVSTSSTSNSPASVSITIPSSALSGSTRMRIRTALYGYGYSNAASDPCSTFSSGCTEDYTINFVAPVLAVPVAGFTASVSSAPLGSQIQFSDLSTGVPSSWKWTFTGGMPATSTSQNPTVTYSTSGTYAVKLVVSNTLGIDSLVKTGYISIANSTIVPATGSASITACGLTVYDNGGTSNYANSSDGSLTIYPATAGTAVRLQFSEFSTESCDYLYIYNGTSTSASLLATYSGSSIPSSVTASNSTGALTLRFYADGSIVYSGFTATTSCVTLATHNVSTTTWTNSIDNNYNGYYQSRTLNLTTKNNGTSAATVYAKIYYKLSTSSTYTLYGQTASFNVSANSMSETQLFNISNLSALGYYDFKIELYNSSNAIISTYDFNDNGNLKSQGFEPVSADGLGSYCTYNLGGSVFDITSVSVTGTTLNNTAIRPTSGAYTAYSALGVYTGTLRMSTNNIINVTTSNNDIVSVWIDYDHNGTFDASEWTLVTSSSNSTVATASIYIPTTALLGSTRLRVRTRSAGTANFSTDACTNFSSGCTEDYVIIIDKLSDNQAISLANMRIYPIPAKDVINIEIPGFESGTLAIFDLVGRKVMMDKITGDLITENVSGLKRGIYFVTVTATDGSSIKKQVIIGQ